ncbi:hypothetical protein P692DRAFT_201916382 [Suillus brevipes Sb2]|nr:hypothetical protein P692DRAFT_201916382 [Suillus brevipes Sb2]
MGCHRGKLVASTDPKYESRIQAALVGIANGTHKNITVAARVHKVAQQTLKDWSMGLHMSHRDFAESWQLLQPSEEEAVKDWLAHESGAACPVHPCDLRSRVNEIHLLCINTYITLHSQVLSIILHSINFFI